MSISPVTMYEFRLIKRTIWRLCTPINSLNDTNAHPLVCCLTLLVSTQPFDLLKKANSVVIFIS